MMSLRLAVSLLVAIINLSTCYHKICHLSQFTRATVSIKHMTNAEVLGADSQTISLVGAARSFASTNLGVTDPSLLSNDFVCSGPSFDNIGKSAYLSGLAKETAVFQRAMPDFNLRPYSFSVDETQPNTVWFKIRPQGTLTGPFTYKGEVYLPNQKLVELPAQQLSVTIRSAQVTRVTAGYTIDRFTGNTGGLAGPAGILYALGAAPSKFDYIPPAVILRRLFSRTKKLVKRRAVKVSPFPAAVMMSLARRLVETTLGAEEPSLLTSEFQFSGPLVGPLLKDEFVKALSSFNLKSPFPDLNSENYNFEVDSYDPERVWVITKGSGTQTGPLIIGGRTLLEPTGNRYEGPPEAVSVSFNEQGLCYRATAGYILDKDVGNTNGLGGVYGIFEAIGSPVPWWESRTVGELPGLLKKAIFRPAARVPAKATKVAKSPSKAPPALTEAPLLLVTGVIAADAPPSVVPKPIVSKPVDVKIVQREENRVKSAEVPVVVKAAASIVKPAAPSFFSFMKPANVAAKKSPPSAKETSVPLPTATSKKSVSPPKVPEKSPTRVPQITQATKPVISTKKITEPPVAVKPKSFGGMFNMEISKGKSGKKSADAPRK